MNNQMFCFQCQETAGGKGCISSGVCGKSPEVAALQDLLVYETKALSCITTQLRKEKQSVDSKTNHLIKLNLFTTITNTNFNPVAIRKKISKTLLEKKNLLSEIKDTSSFSENILWDYESTSLEGKALDVGVLSVEDEDIRSLKEIITYGLKGLAAYTIHANALRKEDEGIDAFMQYALAKTLDDSLSVNDLVTLALQTGRYGISGMALLDRANTNRYGNPEKTEVNIGTRNNPGILISGHDLHDLEMLLEQTKGRGVDVYTHSEMLPAHYYPMFKIYPHFVGNYGNAWWRQKEEFEKFNGPILMTTNCLVPPAESYMSRLWTTGAVGFPGCQHIKDRDGKGKDFSSIIAQAKLCPPPEKIETGKVTGGFAHEYLNKFSDAIVKAVNSKKIRRFLVMAGCDGRMKAREYYTEVAKRLPNDVIILTAGCAKYRFNKLDLGEIDGIPRILDVGQCNDSYSLILTVLQLKDLLKTENINDLPIVYSLSWYEQKAVLVLLSLLHLGIKRIYLGPTHPAFFSSNVKDLLVKTFDIQKIGGVDSDLEALFGSLS